MQLTEEQRKVIEGAAAEIECMHADLMRRGGFPSDGKANPYAQALRELLAAHNAGAQEPVGVAGTMPGTDGFTMAAFRAEDVPVGTSLYTHPQPMTDAARDEIWDKRPTFDTKGVPRMTLRELVREHYQHYFSVDKASALAAEHIAEIERLDRAKGDRDADA